MAIPQIGSFQLQNDSSRLKSLRDIFEDSRKKKKKKKAGTAPQSTTTVTPHTQNEGVRQQN